MGTKISDLPTRVTPLGDDLFVLANDAEALNYKISLADLILQLGSIDMADLTTLLDKDGDTTYVGKAAIGSLTNQAVWKIQRIIDLPGDDLEVKWAASAAFSQIWDNRAGLSYS